MDRFAKKNFFFTRVISPELPQILLYNVLGRDVFILFKVPGFVMTSCMGYRVIQNGAFVKFPPLFPHGCPARLQSTKRRENNCVVVEFLYC